MKNSDILCLGELAIDFICNTDLITDNPSSVILKSFQKFYGGMGGNFAASASVFNPNQAIIAYLEDDAEGSEYKRYLEAKKIDLSSVIQSKWSQHPRCFIVNQNDKTRIFFYAGALVEERKKYLDYAKSLVNKIDSESLYCGSMAQELNSLYLKESKAKIKAYAPAHNTHVTSKENFEECLKNTNILFLNDHESKMVEKMFSGNIFEIAKMFDIGILVKTLGKDGSELIIDGNVNPILPCKAARVLDHTGAGDAYAGAFLANYVKTEDPIYSAKIASASASFVVEEIGCQTGIPTLEKVMERAKATYRDL